MKPLGKRVIIKLEEKDYSTETGIILVNKPRGTFDEGVVLHISDNVDQVSVGDRVLFDKGYGTEIEKNKYILDVGGVFIKLTDEGTK